MSYLTKEQRNDIEQRIADAKPRVYQAVEQQNPWKMRSDAKGLLGEAEDLLAHAEHMDANQADLEKRIECLEAKIERRDNYIWKFMPFRGRDELLQYAKDAGAEPGQAAAIANHFGERK